MAHLPLDDQVFDRSEYDRAARQLRFAKRVLPEDSVSLLAQEVVRRLAFRLVRPSKGISVPQDEVEALCAALLSGDELSGERIILRALRGGADLDTLYLGYIAGAARRLGQMWEDDTASFVEVTLGSGRLYRIIRALRHTLAPKILDGREDRPALLAQVPGESHTIGIEIATDLVRHQGWDVDVALELSHDELVHHSETRNYRAIVLVANSDNMLAVLSRLVVALRITQPLAQIMVAGSILDHFPRTADIAGADGAITRLENVVDRLRDIIADG